MRLWQEKKRTEEKQKRKDTECVRRNSGVCQGGDSVFEVSCTLEHESAKLQCVFVFIV